MPSSVAVTDRAVGRRPRRAMLTTTRTATTSATGATKVHTVRRNSCRPLRMARTLPGRPAGSALRRPRAWARAAAATGARQSPGSPRQASMIERAATSSPPAGWGAKAGAASSAAPPCAPSPGSSSGACGISSRARATASGRVTPTTAPTEDRPELPTARHPGPRDAGRDLLPHPPAAVQRQLLQVGPARVRGPREHEDAAARRVAGVDERLHRVPAEVRVDRQRVGDRQLPAPRGSSHASA